MSWEQTLNSILPPINGNKSNITVNNDRTINDFSHRRDRNKDGDTTDAGDFHGGVDINYKGGGPNPINKATPPVYSPVAGKVEFTGGYENGVNIKDAQGNLHRLLHHHTITATQGATIAKGSATGTMGGHGRNGPNHYAPHVHYDIMNTKGQKVDPVAFWNAAPASNPSKAKDQTPATTPPKKVQPKAAPAPAQPNQIAPAPTNLITKPLSDPRYVQSPKAGLRKLSLPVPADQTEKDLFLVVLDKDLVNAGKKEKHDNSYQIYLGRSKTFKRGEGPDQYNMLVPFIPRCHATADRDPAQAVEVPEGWLYIIRQFTNPLTGDSKPELWRELYSDGLGNFNDVNLKRFEGKDQRKATCQSGIRIIVPHCIDKQDHQLWMAYSEVQWSWNRVQSMKQDSKLREQRMHKLDLSDCLDNFAKSGYKAASPPKKPGGQQDKLEVKNVSGPALLYNLKSAPDPESRDLPASFKDAIPVVYLDNPVGIAKSLAAKYQQQWVDLADCLTDLRAMPDLVTIPGLYSKDSAKAAEDEAKRRNPERWFEAAALANRYFYRKISKEIPPGVTDKDAYRERLAEIDEQFIKYQNKLDKPAIELALWVPQRTEIREKLVRAREHLVDFLEKELAGIQSEKSGGDAQDPPLVQALDDYFTLTPLTNKDKKENKTDPATGESTPVWRDNYLDGWGAVYDILASLAKHEYSLDADLEDKPPDGWQWRRDNRAFELLIKLADPQGDYPLHSRLFPKSTAKNLLEIDAAPVPDKDNNFKKQHLANLKPLLEHDSDIISGLSRFGNNFSELMAMRDDKDPAYEQRLERARYSILRLVDSVVGLQLEETELSLEELIARVKKQAYVDKNGGVTLGEAFLASVGFMDKAIDAASKTPKTAEPGSGSFGKIRVKVITVANRSRTLKLLRDLGDDKAVTSGLAGFLGLVEIHNFTKALKAYTNNQNDDRKWEQFAPLVASFLQLPAAIKGVKGLVAKAAAEAAPKAAAGGGQAVAQVGLDRVREAQAAKVGYSKLFKRLNLIANLIELELTLSSFIENLAQNDDAAIADAIGLGGITFGIVATFVNIPGAGWIICLAAIAYWLAKAYLFVEDVPVEVWLENGPFVRGNEYHEAFCYKLSTTIKKVKDAKGKWVDTACAVHRYDNFEFLVDSGGILVHAGPSQYHPPGQPCRVTPDGAVYLKARKWYDLPTNKHHEIPADTTVATIGQPFTMHPLLKTTVQEKPKITPSNQTGWKKKAALYAVSPVGGFLYDRYQTSKEKFIGWQHPREAYLALADAVYRPRVTLTETSTMIGRRQSTVALKVDLPFYIPGKSELFIEYEVKGGKTIFNNEEIEKISHNPVSNINLNGPGGYEIIRTVYPGESRTFTAKVRLDLFGDGEVQLPCEPLFCGSEIKTEKEEKTVEGVQLQTATKWIVAKKSVTQGPITHFDMILNPGDSGTRHPGKWA